MLRSLAAGVLLIALLGGADVAARVAAAPDAEAAAPARAGAFLVQAVPLEPVRPLRVLDNAGPHTLFEGRCGVELLLTGESADGSVPDLGRAVTVRTDAGEEARVAVEAVETTRQPSGRRFTRRFRLDLSRFQQPFQSARLQGEVCETLGIAAVTKRVSVQLAAGLPAANLGPLRVALTTAPGPSGLTATATCEWTATDPLAGDAARTEEVAGPVSAELRTVAPGRPSETCPLVHTVQTTAAPGGGVPPRRVQKFVWRVSGDGECELALTYPAISRRSAAFVIEGVPVPSPGPPVIARIAAQRLVLGAPGEEPRVEGLEADTATEGDAPHPLLMAGGGSIRFRLRISGQPAGEGAIQAALSPRRGREWGGWHWFHGASDGRGEAVLANVCPGTYRLRIRFRATRGPEYQAADRELLVAVGRPMPPAEYDLLPVGH